MIGVMILGLAGVLMVATLTMWIIGERGRLMLPSTLAFMKEGGVKRLLNFEGLHGYVYGRWTSQYVDALVNQITPRLGPRGKKWIRDRYHGKVLTHDQAQAIIAIEEDIEQRDLEQIIPYAKARDLVLKGPPDVAAYECPCRSYNDNNCGPSQVCMAVGQPFVDFVIEHHPGSARRLTTLGALDMLREEHERGHVHAAWFKDAALGRFYSLCNCCSCCCGGIKTMLQYDSPIVASSGYVSEVDEMLCNACGDCEAACPFQAITVNVHAVVGWEKCMGCGVCEGQCTQDAITLVRDEAKGIPLDVRLITQS
jgi:ferredoxin